ncbi:hypothetical protein [Brucella pseudogrignonensis]|uniref:Uncharacterized protein n=1 Tax=Brucella pseudogrignonensis TaxID=419475 RepID=A0ABU1M5F9_9HYPH|nr:hypothetical protein [Brucella pseudogrignonensis]MDR6431278.1 hypothetical protein [Brucella pseudogrignonensis]
MSYQVGQTVSFRDCYGSNPKTGKIVERNAYSSLIDVNGSSYLVPDCLIDATDTKEETRSEGSEKQPSLF